MLHRGKLKLLDKYNMGSNLSLLSPRAEEVGFEPDGTIFQIHTLSRRALSASQSLFQFNSIYTPLGTSNKHVYSRLGQHIRNSSMFYHLPCSLVYTHGTR